MVELILVDLCFGLYGDFIVIFIVLKILSFLEIYIIGSNDSILIPFCPIFEATFL